MENLDTREPKISPEQGSWSNKLVCKSSVPEYVVGCNTSNCGLCFLSSTILGSTPTSLRRGWASYSRSFWQRILWGGNLWTTAAARPCGRLIPWRLGMTRAWMRWLCTLGAPLPWWSLTAGGTSFQLIFECPSCSSFVFSITTLMSHSCFHRGIPSCWPYFKMSLAW